MKRRKRLTSRARWQRAVKEAPFELTMDEVMRDLDPGREVWQKPGREFHTRTIL